MGALPMHVPDFKTVVMPAIVAAIDEWKSDAEKSGWLFGDCACVYFYVVFLVATVNWWDRVQAISGWRGWVVCTGCARGCHRIGNACTARCGYHIEYSYIKACVLTTYLHAFTPPLHTHTCSGIDAAGYGAQLHHGWFLPCHHVQPLREAQPAAEHAAGADGSRGARAGWGQAEKQELLPCVWRGKGGVEGSLLLRVRPMT